MTRARAFVLLLVFVQGLVWWIITPPWAAPDEPGHYLYARFLADHGLSLHRQPDISWLAATEQNLIASLNTTGWWRYNGRAQPHPLPDRFVADPVLAASGDQIQDEPLLFYIVPALAMRWGLDRLGLAPDQALRWLRLWPFLLRLIAVGIAMAFAAGQWPHHQRRVLALGLLVGMLPMVGFIAGSLNNEALAIVWGVATFALLAMPSRPGKWPLALVFVILGPLLAERSLLIFWPLALILALAELFPRPRQRLLLSLALIAVIILALAPNPRWAAGWRRAPELITSRNDDGLTLQPGPGSLSQFIGGKMALALRNQPLRLSASFVGDPHASLRLRISDGLHEDKVACRPTSPCQLDFTPSPLAVYVRVILSPDPEAQSTTEPLRSIRVHLQDATGRDLLFNGDGHLPEPLSAPLLRQLERRLPIPAGFFAQALAATAWDAASQLRYILFAGFTWASFWGYFGWLNRPWPWWIYLFLAGLTLLAGWGLLRWTTAATRRWRHHSLTADDRLLAISILAVAFALILTWMPMIGQAWQPQGRYLFPALLPISLTLLCGWEHALPTAWRHRLLPLLLIILCGLNLIAWMVVAA